MYIYIYGTLWDHVLAKTKDTAERGWPDAQWLVSTSNDSSGATWGRKQKSSLELGGSGKFWRKAQILGQTTCHNCHNFDFAGTYVAKEKHADPA